MAPEQMSLLFLAIVIIIGLLVLFWIVPIGLWIAAIFAGVRVRIIELIGNAAPSGQSTGDRQCTDQCP